MHLHRLAAPIAALLAPLLTPHLAAQGVAPSAELEVLGPGTLGARGVARLEAQAPFVGDAFAMRVRHGRPGAHGCLFLNLAAQPIPLPPFGTTLFPSLASPAVAPFVLNAVGETQPLFALPEIPPAFSGADLFAQAFFFDGEAMGGLAFTRALRSRFGIGTSRPLFPGSLVPSFSPTDAASLDLDGDGNPDLLSKDGGSLLVSLGRGDGTFLPPIVSTVANGNRFVTLDANGDGIADLVVNGVNEFSLVLGQGDGTFTNPTSFPLGTSISEFETADFDADGRTDLAAVGLFSGNVTILRGIPGGFASPDTIPVGNSPTDLVAGDFDGNGSPDLAVTLGGDSEIVVLLGDGTGSFASPSVVGVVPAPQAVAASDFDLDGVTDLVAAHQTDGIASVLFGLGNGSFAPPQPIGTGDLLSTDVVAADFNGDGTPDFAIVARAESRIRIFEGDGLGSFVEAAAIEGLVDPLRVVADDWNLDGLPDLVCVDPEQGAALFLNRENGSFRAPIVHALAAEGPTDLAIADFDEDGTPDVVTSNLVSDSASVLLGNGDGTLTQTIELTTPIARPSAVAASDLDDDGHVDLAISHDEGGGATLFYGAGDGTFSAPSTLTTTNGATHLAIEDVTGDGLRDLIVASRSLEVLQVFVNTGGRTYGPPTDYQLVCCDLRDIAIEDFDGDGDLDLAGTSGFESQLLLNDGTGTFTFGPTAMVGSGPTTLRRFAFTDLDGDADFDLIGASPGQLRTFSADTPGNYGPAVISTSSGDPTGIAVGDLDLDGVADCVVSLGNRNRCDVAIGTGTGTFTATTHASGAEPSSVVLADMNGDGALDVVLTNEDSNTVVVLLNQLFD